MILTITLNPSIDRTIYTESLRPHDTNRIFRSELDAGGKGINVARMFCELGGAATATGFMGGDVGSVIQRVLSREGVTEKFVNVSGEVRVNTSVEDESGKPPTTFNERGPEISRTDFESLLLTAKNIALDCDFVTIGGSLPPGVTTDDLERMMKSCGDARLVLDADGDALKRGLSCKPFLVKPNAAEAGRLLGSQITTREQAVDAARKIRSQFGVETVIVSMAESGAAAVSADGVFFATPPRICSRSTIGSGDSMVAGVLFALTQAKTFADALRLGTACGAATALSDGSSLGKRQDVDALLQNVIVEEL